VCQTGDIFNSGADGSEEDRQDSTIVEAVSVDLCEFLPPQPSILFVLKRYKWQCRGDLMADLKRVDLLVNPQEEECATIAACNWKNDIDLWAISQRQGTLQFEPLVGQWKVWSFGVLWARS
jgi:hypothetical protein